jgi:D-alanyl-D-alanine carboxypeptidase
VLLVAVALFAAGCSDDADTAPPGSTGTSVAAPPVTTTPPETTVPTPTTTPSDTTALADTTVPPTSTTAPSRALTVDEDALQATLDQWRTDVGAFGATLSVRVPGHDDIHLASGVDDRNPQTPMPTDGTYLAMSITKTVVAAIALQLVDEGRLSLDEPVAAWIPELPNADRITLAMLLGHTSGLGDWDPVDTVLEDLTRSFTPEEVLAEAIAAAPYGQPGEHFAYTNGGYAATGLIIERVLGEPLAEVVDKRIAGPLALDDTLLGDGSTKPTRHGWFSLPPDNVDPNRPLDTLDFPHEAYLTSLFGSATLISSSQDLLDWGEALYTGDLLGEQATASMLEMRSSFLPPDPGSPLYVATDRPTPLHYGLGAMGFCLDQNGCNPDDVAVFAHGGRGVGTRTLVAHHPDSGTTIVVHANVQDIELLELTALLPDVLNQLGTT